MTTEITAAVIAETEKVCAEATPDWEVSTAGLWQKGTVRLLAAALKDATIDDLRFMAHARTWLPIFARTVAEQRQRLEEIFKLSDTCPCHDHVECVKAINAIQSLAQEGGK